MLLTGTVPPDEGTPLLKENLRGIGKPPKTAPRKWSVDVRGFGEQKVVDASPRNYLQAIRQRPPEGIDMTHVVFLPTRR
jgi:hypothetical protein